MNENDLMGSMKVSKAVAKMAIPSVISSLVTVVYNMADTFFVGQTGDPLQVAAVSLTNPIFILLMAFANICNLCITDRRDFICFDPDFLCETDPLHIWCEQSDL